MTRKSPEIRQVQALDSGLRGLFRALKQRPVPDRLLSVVDEVYGDAAAPRMARRG